MTRQIPVSAYPFQLGAPLVALEGDTACQKTEAPTSMAKSGRSSVIRPLYSVFDSGLYPLILIHFSTFARSPFTFTLYSILQPTYPLCTP